MPFPFGPRQCGQSNFPDVVLGEFAELSCVLSDCRAIEVLVGDLESGSEIGVVAPAFSGDKSELVVSEQPMVARQSRAVTTLENRMWRSWKVARRGR